MKHPLEILPHHEQKHNNSCVAWGLELVLKMHEKIGLNDFPLQTDIEPITKLGPCDWGFGQTERNFLFENYGVKCREEKFDLQNFEKNAKEESQKNYPIIFSIIDHVEGQNEIHVIYHIWIASWEHNSLQCLSRSYNNPKILSQLPLAAVFHAARTQVSPDYRIDCLLHS